MKTWIESFSVAALLALSLCLAVNVASPGQLLTTGEAELALGGQQAVPICVLSTTQKTGGVCANHVFSDGSGTTYKCTGLEADRTCIGADTKTNIACDDTITGVCTGDQTKKGPNDPGYVADGSCTKGKYANPTTVFNDKCQVSS